MMMYTLWFSKHPTYKKKSFVNFQYFLTKFLLRLITVHSQDICREEDTQAIWCRDTICGETDELLSC